MNNEYPEISRYYEFDNNYILGIDQTNCNEDRTCLCFAKLDDDKMIVKDVKYIEKQRDMDKYINKNLKEIYGVFGLSLEE